MDINFLRKTKELGSSIDALLEEKRDSVLSTDKGNVFVPMMVQAYSFGMMIFTSIPIAILSLKHLDSTQG